MLHGFADLRSSSELIKKLRYDYEKMLKNPSNSYEAFNFFVTAEHILDWKFPGGRGSDGEARRTELRDKHQILKVVSHIANGAKHFILESKRHNSVSHVDSVGGSTFNSFMFNSVPFNSQSDLIVSLEGEAAIEFGSSISAIDLAQKALSFWNEFENND